jgi:hypothetical protein
MNDDEGSEESDLNNMTAKLKESPVKIIPFKAKPLLYQAHFAQKQQEILLESESEDSAREVYTQQVPTNKMVVYSSS